MPDQTLDGAGGASEDGGQTTGQPEGLAGRGEGNWDEHPGVRHTKSLLDREKAAREQERQAFELRMQDAEARAQAAEANAVQFADFMKQYDPEAAQDFLARAEADTLKRENEQLRQRLNAQREEEERQRRAYEEAVTYHEGVADALGLDKNDPRFRTALDSGDITELERVKAEMLMEQRQPKSKPEPREPQPHDNVVLPARGTPPGTPSGKLQDEFEKRKLELRQGDALGLMELQKEFRQRGLDTPYGVFNAPYAEPE